MGSKRRQRRRSERRWMWQREEEERDQGYGSKVKYNSWKKRKSTVLILISLFSSLHLLFPTSPIVLLCPHPFFLHLLLLLLLLLPRHLQLLWLRVFLQKYPTRWWTTTTAEASNLRFPASSSLPDPLVPKGLQPLTEAFYFRGQS